MHAQEGRNSFVFFLFELLCVVREIRAIRSDYCLAPSIMTLRTCRPVETPRNSFRPAGASSEGESPRRSSTSCGTFPPPAARTATIVVIDDSVTALTVASHWLEEEGHRVVPLPRALGATSTLLHVRPDVLLLDIQLPGLSGDRFARILTQSPATASIPVIFHSQIDPVALKRLAYECAVVGAIPKTTSRNVFMHEFNKLAGPFLHSSLCDEVTYGQKAPDPLDMGIAEIDIQRHHIKRLAGRIADILRDVKAHDDRLSTRKQLRSAVLELLVFMRYHLVTEDRYLRHGACTSIGEHRQRHEAYLDESKTLEHTLDMDPTPTDLLDCARRIRLLALEHLWSIDAQAFQVH